MSNYAVLGLGMMGSAICYDILHFDESSFVYGFDIDSIRLKEASQRLKKYSDRFKCFPLNLRINDPIESHPLLEYFKKNNINLVFGAIDYRFNYFLSKLCIAAGVNFIDLGGNPEVVKQQHCLNDEAKTNNIAIIPDLGLAPGMINIIAASAMNKFNKLEECHLRVGGLPQTPKNILKYQQAFSIRGLTNEYLEDAFIIRNHKITVVPSLTEIESLNFPEPWETLEAFQTAGGSSSLPKLYEGKVKELTYKTIRFPGHCGYFKFLKEFGLLSSDPLPFNPNFSPREVIEYYLEKKLPRNEPDVVIARITVTGMIQNNKKKHLYQLIDYMNPKTGFSAMARTTAYPTSIVGQFLANNIVQKKGVLFAEQVVPYELFFKELEKRNIIFSFEEKSEV